VDRLSAMQVFARVARRNAGPADGEPQHKEYQDIGERTLEGVPNALHVASVKTLIVVLIIARRGYSRTITGGSRMARLRGPKDGTTPRT